MPHKFITLTGRAKDITGQRFGRWIALGPVAQTADKAIIWLCRCDCGRTVPVHGLSLRRGRSRSCGCLQREDKAAEKTTHGMSNSPLYYVWANMLQRCMNPQNANYANYGGRGIAVCEEWQNAFEPFHAHVSQLPNFEAKAHSLDRIDNDGNYEPGNVRWASIGKQNRNYRANHMLTHNGKTQCLRDWARELSIKESTLHSRFCKGWDTERALTTPVALR